MNQLYFARGYVNWQAARKDQFIHHDVHHHAMPIS